MNNYQKIPTTQQDNDNTVNNIIIEQPKIITRNTRNTRNTENNSNNVNNKEDETYNMCRSCNIIYKVNNNVTQGDAQYYRCSNCLLSSPNVIMNSFCLIS